MVMIFQCLLPMTSPCSHYINTLTSIYIFNTFKGCTLYSVMLTINRYIITTACPISPQPRMGRSCDGPGWSTVEGWGWNGSGRPWQLPPVYSRCSRSKRAASFLRRFAAFCSAAFSTLSRRFSSSESSANSSVVVLQKVA